MHSCLFLSLGGFWGAQEKTVGIEAQLCTHGSFFMCSWPLKQAVTETGISQFSELFYNVYSEDGELVWQYEGMRFKICVCKFAQSKYKTSFRGWKCQLWERKYMWNSLDLSRKTIRWVLILHRSSKRTEAGDCNWLSGSRDQVSDRSKGKFEVVPGEDDRSKFVKGKSAKSDITWGWVILRASW